MSNMKCVEPFSIGNRNGRGKGLLYFAEEFNLVTATSFFQKAANRYWTWQTSGATDKNKTDFIKSLDRKIVGNCEVITKVNIGSDHKIVRG